VKKSPAIPGPPGVVIVHMVTMYILSTLPLYCTEMGFASKKTEKNEKFLKFFLILAAGKAGAGSRIQFRSN